MAQVYKPGISLTFTVAMVKNGRQNRLKIGIGHFGADLRRLTVQLT